MRPSLARDFFEQITQCADPIAAIRGLVTSSPPTFETDWRDFKGEGPDPKQREKYIRFEWSRALGGFANNQGGVLIWGIDARKKPYQASQIDAAGSEKPMANPIVLKSRLAELQRGATDPPLANVEIEAYELPNKPDSGFVVCYVPEGPFKPYRSEQADQQFYLRAGDNTVVMSRSLLQSLFYPKAKAVLCLEVDLSWEFPDRDHFEQKLETALTLEVRISNKGTATARHVQLRMEHDLRPKPIRTTAFQLGYAWNQEDGFFVRVPPLHPGIPAAKVFSWKWITKATYSHGENSREVPLCENPEFAFTTYVENQEPQMFKVKFDIDELVNFPSKTIVVVPE